MYLSRPKITPDYVDKQLLKVDTNSQKQKETTAMVQNRDDSVRHPVTKQWTRAYQNQQSEGDTDPVEDSTETGAFTAGKRKGV